MKQKIPVHFEQPPQQFIPAILRAPRRVPAVRLDSHIEQCPACRTHVGLLCPTGAGLYRLTAGS